jgi:glycosyltransferase involved in cell wall biosynthesis
MSSVTVVIPTFNDRQSLYELLDVLNNQEDPDFLLIVVDNGSSASSEEKLNNYKKSHQSLNLKVLTSKENLGAGGGRNFSLNSITTPYVAFTDDDCMVPKNWIKTINELIKDKRHKVFFGPVNSEVLPRPPYIHGFDLKGQAFGTGNCIFETKFLIEIGGFDLYLNNWAEDYEIDQRCRRNGAVPYFSANLLISHPVKIIPYIISKNIMTISFLEKYYYILFVRKYIYKEHLLLNVFLTGLKKLLIFLFSYILTKNIILCLVLHTALCLLFYGKKIIYVKKVEAQINSTPRVSNWNFLKYMLSSSYVDIYNGIVAPGLMTFLIVKRGLFKNY